MGGQGQSGQGRVKPSGAAGLPQPIAVSPTMTQCMHILRF